MKSRFTKDGVRRYEKRRYRGLDQKIVHAREIRLLDRALREIARAGNSAADTAVLDVPCGYGRFTEFFLRRGLRVTNSDLSLEMVRRAGEPGVAGAVADAAAGLPFRDGAFAAVFSIRLFHHLREPEVRGAVLRELRRVSSGWAVVTFYRVCGIHVWQRRVRRLFGKSRTNIKILEKGVFEAEARAAGFEAAAVWPLFRGLHAYHLALLRKRPD
jgi:SAM-dependent methyltransferase